MFTSLDPLLRTLHFDDIQFLALTLNSPRTRIIQDMMDSETLTDTSSDIDDMFTFDDNLPDVPTGIPTDIETMDPNTCDDWEVFDGSVCVCADYSESRCTGAGGMVCDVHGGKHDSLCVFALEMCHGDVSLDENIVSCGLCDVLRLVDESEMNSPSVSPGDIDDEEFELEDPTNKTHLVYRSTKSQLMVFFDETVHRWVIGEQHDVDSLIAMVQEEYVDFPQDSQAGFLVATSNGTDVTWEINPTMRLNCVNRKISTKRPDKRFLVTLVVVAVVATTTAYTLRKIQEKKGCLYYPSVCRLRDELKKKLEPEVKKLQSDFKKSYGDIAKFKNEVESSTEVVMDIKDRLVSVKELTLN
ncbi:hypothetical protein FSP39_017143 [Pinctada imbricata]|uniref:Uncharacterized protein n=1 Tax=Pinctada imbricata TaxID=66713 RepID=A0AA88YHQ7_PINIB|nr:hypothetical protein FSP39_017143 [Pinctada imbricata]